MSADERVIVTMPDADQPAPDLVWAGCDKGLVPRGTPARAPLNFDQLQRVMAAHFGAQEMTDDEADSAEAFARAVERAHGIGA